jgi:hypothetical protein
MKSAPLGRLIRDAPIRPVVTPVTVVPVRKVDMPTPATRGLVGVVGKCPA